MENLRPKIGVGVIVIKNSQVLMGQRKNSHGAGSWSFPGGHLEYRETLAGCASREVKEETGLEIANVRLATVTNDIFEAEQKHYVTLYLLADYTGGAPTVREPKKCTGWQWFDWHALPKPLFLPVQNLLKTGFKPF